MEWLMPELGLKVGIVGPSRVGKTSLLTSILADSERVLAGHAARIQAGNEETTNLLAAQRREMESSIQRRQFDPGGLSGNTEANRFALELAVGNFGVGLDFLDYPGGWLQANGASQGGWEDCREFLMDSSVVLVPIDSAVLMEAYLNEHQGQIPRLLCTTEVESLLREWSKALLHGSSRPGLVLFVPLKCESYFDDNHGHQDKSGELLNAVNKHYGKALKAIEQEDRDTSRIRVLYAPVDTYGCVDVCHPRWSRNDSGELSFFAKYRVRSGGTMQPYGAENLLYAVCSHLLGIAAAAQEEDTAKVQGALHENLEKLRNTSGWLLKFITQITGHRKDWTLAAKTLGALLAEHKEDAEKLYELVVELNRRELTPRAKYLR